MKDPVTELERITEALQQTAADEQAALVSLMHRRALCLYDCTSNFDQPDDRALRAARRAYAAGEEAFNRLREQRAVWQGQLDRLYQCGCLTRTLASDGWAPTVNCHG